MRVWISAKFVFSETSSEQKYENRNVLNKAKPHNHRMANKWDLFITSYTV